MKPLEIEVIVAEVGDERYEGHKENTLYRINFDGFISDHHGYVVIGGSVDDVEAVLRTDYRPGLSEREAVQLGRRALDTGADRGGASLNENSLEVCTLERRKPGRKFRRLPTEEVRSMLEG